MSRIEKNFRINELYCCILDTMCYLNVIGLLIILCKYFRPLFDLFSEMFYDNESNLFHGFSVVVIFAKYKVNLFDAYYNSLASRKLMCF